MTRDFWKRKLSSLLGRSDELSGEEAYEIKKDTKVVFWCNGGLKVEGNRENLTINFNDPDLLILITMKGRTGRIYRIPYSHIVCFELIHEFDKGEKPSITRFLPN